MAAAGAAIVVQPGDTISGIAERYGITSDELLTANPIVAERRPESPVGGSRYWLNAGELVFVPGAFTIVDSLGSATPTSRFDERSGSAMGTCTTDDDNFGPGFTLAGPTLITEVGAFLSSVTRAPRVEIRPSVGGEPDPSVVVASFVLSGPGLRDEATYGSAVPDVILPAGSYFALFGSGNCLLSSASVPSEFRPTPITVASFDRTRGTAKFSTADWMAVRIVGRSAFPTETPIAIPTPMPTPTNSASTASPPPLTGTYAVATGDTLSAIGERYGLSIEQLLAANPRITDRSLIRSGDSLTVPLGLLPIANATLDLPALPAPPAELPGCVAGRVTFTGGYAFLPGVERHWYDSTWIDDAVRADVDHDGTKEVVALIKCQPSQGSFGRVVAFRPLAGGRFATIGLVLQQDWGEGDEDSIRRLSWIDATSQGETVVGVEDNAATYTSGPWQGVCQARTYGWNGHAFVQTAGSKSFLVPPGTVNLMVTTPPMTFAKPAKGVRLGTLTVTVRNAGKRAVEDVWVLAPMEPPAVCADPSAGRDSVCEIGRLEPGEAATVTFHESIACPSDATCADAIGEPAPLQVRIGDQKYVFE